MRGLRSTNGLPVNFSKVFPWISATPYITPREESCKLSKVLYASMNFWHFIWNAWLASEKNRELPSALNSLQSSNLKPHMDTRSNRLDKIVNSLTESKANAKEGVRWTMTFFNWNEPVIWTPSKVWRLTCKSWIWKIMGYYWVVLQVTLTFTKRNRKSKANAKEGVRWTMTFFNWNEPVIWTPSKVWRLTCKSWIWKIMGYYWVNSQVILTFTHEIGNWKRMLTTRRAFLPYIRE